MRVANYSANRNYCKKHEDQARYYHEWSGRPTRPFFAGLNTRNLRHFGLKTFTVGWGLVCQN